MYPQVSARLLKKGRGEDRSFGPGGPSTDPTPACRNGGPFTVARRAAQGTTGGSSPLHTATSATVSSAGPGRAPGSLAARFRLTVMTLRGTCMVTFVSPQEWARRSPWRFICSSNLASMRARSRSCALHQA